MLRLFYITVKFFDTKSVYDVTNNTHHRMLERHF